MTCIVGMIENGKVVMGADSIAISGLDARHRKDPKIFRNGQYIIGFTSSYRMGQILRTTKIPEFKLSSKMDEFEFMISIIVPAVREALTKGGYTKKKNEREEGGTFLVGFNGRIFSIQDDFQVTESSEGYDACGCGEPYALAALKTCRILWPSEASAEAILTTALGVAAHYSSGVGGPFTILEEE